MNYQRLKKIGSDGEVIKGKTPNRGANPYVDNYVGFTWNNVHSSAFNCFIENTGHLDFVGAPDFSNNFVSPAFQTRSYYTGMQTSSKKISLNLVFYQLTLKELNAALHWLDRSIVSDLFFDYELYWKYSCKLASMGVMEKYVSGRTMYRGRPCDLYLCKVAVQFETVYHPEAISAYCAYKNSTKDDYVAILVRDTSDDTYAYRRCSQYDTDTQYAWTYLDCYTFDDIDDWERVDQSDLIMSDSPFVAVGTQLIMDGNVPVTVVDTLNMEINLLEYSKNTGADYMPFTEYDYGSQSLTTTDGFYLVDNRTLTLVTNGDIKNWRPMIIMAEDGDNKNTDSMAYWRFALKNPSAHSTYFKLHFYNIASSVTVYQYWNNDWFGNGTGASLGLTDEDGWVLPTEMDIDAYENSMCICSLTLNLDDDIWLDAHYNSEDGTILCANQLIESLRSGAVQVPCIHKDSVANVYLPGAPDSDHPSTVMIEISMARKAGDSKNIPQIAIEYDTYEYTV